VNDVNYCDVLLPDICQVPSCWRLLLPAHHACARALSCCDTRLRTSHQTWPPNRPDLSSVDCRLLRAIQECVYQKQQGTHCSVNNHNSSLTTIAFECTLCSLSFCFRNSLLETLTNLSENVRQYSPWSDGFKRYRIILLLIKYSLLTAM